MKRPLAVIGLTYLATSAVAVCFFPEVNFILCAMAAICAIAACLRFSDRKGDILTVLCPICVALLVIGFCQQKASALSDQLGNKSCVISGEICEMPRRQYGRWRYIIETDRVELPGVKQDIRILMTSRSSIDEAKEGDRLTCEVQFLPGSTETGYNSTTSLRADGVEARAWCMVYGEQQVTRGSAGFRYFPMKIRRAITSSIRKALPEHAAAMLCGMILGDTDYMDARTVDNFRSTGIAHLLAVSGLHLTLLTIALNDFFKMIRMPKRGKVVTTILFILLFMAVTGFPPSVVRAGMMHISDLTSRIFLRESDSPTAISVAVLIMCLANPWAAADIGLQLSVCSTLGLLFASEKINQAMKQRARQLLIRIGRMPENKRVKRLGKRAIRSLSSTLTASLFILPLTAVHFGSIPLISPVTNLLCVYIASDFIIIGVIASAIYAIPLVGWILSMPLRFAAAVICAYLEAVTGGLAKLPFSVLNTSYPYMPYLFGFITALVCVSLLSCRIIGHSAFSGRLRGLVLCEIAVLAFAGVLSNEIFCKGPEVIVFDVSGGGVCVCAKNGTRAVFAEAGGDAFALSDIRQTLHAKGVRKVDAIALSDDSKARGNNIGRLTSLFEPDYLITDAECDIRSDTRLLPFANGIRIASLSIKAETLTDSGGGRWQRLQCGDMAVLVCPEKGDCSLLPESWRTADAVVVGKEIIGISSLNVGAVITTATDKNAGKLLLRLRASGFRHIYATCESGDMILSVKDGKLRVSAAG